MRNINTYAVSVAIMLKSKCCNTPHTEMSATLNIASTNANHVLCSSDKIGFKNMFSSPGTLRGRGLRDHVTAVDRLNEAL